MSDAVYVPPPQPSRHQWSGLITILIMTFGAGLTIGWTTRPKPTEDLVPECGAPDPVRQSWIIDCIAASEAPLLGRHSPILECTVTSRRLFCFEPEPTPAPTPEAP